MHNFVNYFVSLFLAVFLAACSGGGGGSTANSDPAITSFVSSASIITLGQSVNLTSVFANGTASINNNVGSVTSGTVKSVTPSSTTSYTISVTKAGANTVTSTLTITVVPAPIITSFSSSSSMVTLGSSANLTAVFADGTASIDKNVGAVISNTAKSVTPSSTTTYTLTVTNDAGTSVSATVTIITDSIVQISWNSNPETAVNRSGGGYKIYYSANTGFAITDGGVTEIDIPYSTGSAAPTSTNVQFSPGTYYIRILAYSALDAPGDSGGSISTATTQTSLVVP